MQTNNVVRLRVKFKDTRKYIFSPTPFTFQEYAKGIISLFPYLAEWVTQEQAWLCT